MGIGGWGGIRTHETLAGPPVFKTGAFNRSATHPRQEHCVDPVARRTRTTAGANRPVGRQAELPPGLLLHGRRRNKRGVAGSPELGSGDLGRRRFVLSIFGHLIDTDEPVSLLDQSRNHRFHKGSRLVLDAM